MKEKIYVIIVTLLICLSAIVIFPSDFIVEASLEDMSIDDQMIVNITENLSNVIYDAYGNGELQKGRAFGSKGEHYTADYI